MHVGLICGSIPSVRCGVADYSRLLADALEVAGIRITRLDGSDWSLRALHRMLKRADRQGCDALHIQYPAMGFGWSLVPHAIGYFARVPTVVTLHEFDLSVLPRKISIAAFAGGVRHLVFTTDRERAAFVRRMSWVSPRTSIVPIGSNVPFLAPCPPTEPVIACFGQVKANRGWEAFIELARHAQAGGRNYRFRMIGSAIPGQQEYLATLRRSTANLPIDWQLDMAPDRVAVALSTATLAYLPYPDGVSARRGSLLAAMGNGLPIVTSSGAACPPELKEIVHLVHGTSEALGRVDAIVRAPALARRMRRAGTTFAARFGWDSIAQKHAAIYERVLRRSSPPASEETRPYDVSCH
ncbi:MAG TPA: glycosyltransferase family 4 protein [Alphaproteobacteria bacterium]